MPGEITGVREHEAAREARVASTLARPSTPRIWLRLGCPLGVRHRTWRIGRGHSHLLGNSALKVDYRLDYPHLRWGLVWGHRVRGHGDSTLPGQNPHWLHGRPNPHPARGAVRDLVVLQRVHGLPLRGVAVEPRVHPCRPAPSIACPCPELRHCWSYDPPWMVAAARDTVHMGHVRRLAVVPKRPCRFCRKDLFAVLQRPRVV